jgi:glyoxylase I family protein
VAPTSTRTPRSARPSRPSASVGTPRSFDHVDLVISSLEAGIDFYLVVLGPLGWRRSGDIVGERGERVTYLASDAGGELGLRERQAGDRPPERYDLGLHHLAFRAPSRDAVDACARRLGELGALIESGPREYDYAPGYYAVFFYDPDGLKLEVVHRTDK